VILGVNDQGLCSQPRTLFFCTGSSRGLLGNLLCVANFPANTGFAWTFIEGLFAGLAGALHDSGVSTWVAYPEVSSYPETLRASPAEPIQLRVAFEEPASLYRLARAVRLLRVSTLYLCDRPTWHPGYGLLRLCGVRTIIVHDHTSGAYSAPSGLRAW